MFISRKFCSSFVASMCLIGSYACCEEYTIKIYSKDNMPSNCIIDEVEELLKKEGTNLTSNLTYNYTPYCYLSRHTFSCFNRLFISFDDKDHVVGCCFVGTLSSFLNIEAFVVEDCNLIDTIGNALIYKVEDFARDSKMSGIVLQASMSDFFKNLGYVDAQIIPLRMIKYLK